MLKVLVAAAGYPDLEGGKALYYIHSRNLYYKKNGINVTVLNFECDKEYMIDEIRVIGEEKYDTEDINYDLLICHAANIRNHYLFLRKYGNKFDKIVFVFHGHEILHLNKYYPEPYRYMKDKKKSKFFQNMYDSFKIALWKRYWLSNSSKIKMIFVSEWLRNQFYKETGFSKERMKNMGMVISNSVGSFFENNRYLPEELTYDFITVRNNLDGSKYAVDIVINLANKYPEFNFLIIGKGKFFDFFCKPKNVTWINTELSHDEIATYINKSKYALLPTREDTQGLMACEMATYGIPLITSDIDVCIEVFKTCPIVAFINNDKPNLKEALSILNNKKVEGRWKEYFSENTVMKEISLLKDFAYSD